MKTTLSFTALALLATSLIMPMQASAADRQITVNSKIQSFSVEKTADTQDVEVADVAPTEPQKKVSPRFFRVNDQPEATQVSSNDDNNNEPKFTPKKKKSFRFQVEKPAPQSAAIPAEDDDSEVASSEDDRPANLLNEKVKLVKKAPAPQIEDDAAINEDSDNEAIAADQPKTAAPAEDAETESDDDALVAQMVAEVKRRKHHVVVEDNYQYDDAGYEQSYSGSSCHNTNSY
jgi:hypothetical protein